MYPIKLHIYSRNKEIKTTYIFISNADKETQNILKSSEHKSISSANINKLKKIYGSKWRELLNIKDKYKGGDILDEEITLDELNAIANIKQGIQHTAAQHDAEQRESAQDEEHKKDDKIKITKNVYVFDVVLYPHDNILEFKKKISLLLGISIYKQHIWYKHSNKYFNLMYNLYLQDKTIPISILDILESADGNQKNIEKIEDIPILIDFYNAKKLLSIKAYDSFTILEEMVNDLGVIEFNLISMDDFIISDNLSNLKTNEVEIIYYGFIILFWPMLSYTAWVDYLHSTSTFEKIYPDLALNTPKYKKIFDMEKSITYEAFETTKLKNNKVLQGIEKALYISITYTNIQVLSIYSHNVVNLRNLFDKFRLNDNIIASKCSILHNGQKIILDKVFKNNDNISIVVPLRAFVLRIKTKLNVLDLYIFQNGNYTIKAKWPEESLFNFEDIFNETCKYINPIIDIINKFGNYVIHSNASLQKMTLKNTKFSEVYMSLIYRTSIKYKDFKILENILNDYEQGGIISLNQINHATNTLEYYFSKGMYKFDASRIEKYFVIDNYYNFLTNVNIKTKWQQLFTFNRNTTFQFRQGDIKISIEGIRENEFSIFYMYIINALYKMHTQQNSYAASNIGHVKQKRNIKSLKQQDPILYDFKKLYNSPIIYSKICQKPYQPIILSNDEYAELDKKDKNRVISYWNFTTNSPANYFCPNTKYPYIQFTIKKHPKDYCIPCCKKKPITKNDNKIRQAIFNACLTEHSYKMEKTNLIQDTRYIMNYGKFISAGRICNLPENSIEPLLYENFSEHTAGVEPQCEELNRYYVYGIDQHTNNISDIGYIISLAFSLDMSVNDLVHSLIQHVKKDSTIFRILLDGDIIKYFYSSQDLTTSMYNTFFQPLVKNADKPIPWNDIFQDLAYYYLNILTILFIDKSHNYENIKLLIDRKNANAEQISDDYKILMIIKKNNYYNPIYYINSIVYFRTKMITTKLFDNTNNISSILRKAISFNENFANNEESGNNKPDINLTAIQSFINSISNKHYSITAYFINDNNLCYYIEIIKNTKEFYFPVKFSPYSLNKENADAKIIYECFNTKKYKTSFKLLNDFIKDLNHWIAVESETRGFILPDVKKNLPVEQRVNPIYKFIRINKWLLLNNPYSAKNKNAVIGFKHNNINYYHEFVTKEHAKKLHNTGDENKDFEQLLYHPDEINLSMSKKLKPQIDSRIKNITKNIYDYYIYELLLLEFTEFFNKEKNAQLRHSIKKQILKTIDISVIETNNNISEFITKYFDKYPNEPEQSKQEDTLRIINQLNDYIIKHHDKKLLLNQIDISFYNFDKVKINYLKTLEKSAIIKELSKIAQKIVIVVPEAGISKLLTYKEEFPNMLISCQDKQSKDNIYCKQNKLIITSKKLHELLEIMAADILNPFKQKWLFNVIFTDQIINYFRFKYNVNEHITISIQ